jgi:uncharacterized protein YjcR
MKKKVVRGNPRLFTLARQMHLAGVAATKIAEIVGKHPGTIRVWLKYETWEAYCHATRVRTNVYRHPAGIEVKAEAKAPELNNFEMQVLERLSKIETYLSQKKVIW